MSREHLFCIKIISKSHYQIVKSYYRKKKNVNNCKKEEKAEAIVTPRGWINIIHTLSNFQQNH